MLFLVYFFRVITDEKKKKINNDKKIGAVYRSLKSNKFSKYSADRSLSTLYISVAKRCVLVKNRK